MKLDTKAIVEREQERLEHLRIAFQMAAPEEVTVLNVKSRDMSFDEWRYMFGNGGVRTVFEVEFVMDGETYTTYSPLDSKEVFYTTGWWIFKRTRSYTTEDWPKMMENFRECLERN